MKQQPKTVPGGHFKAHCLALLDKVAHTRQPLIVTKRGKPVAKVGFDAVHLASAVWLKTALSEQMTLAAAGGRLLKAAEAENPGF